MGSVKPPLVAVVIPAFNAERTLAETLASVAAQTYPAIEIIVVDDGSTDRTAAIAEAFAAGDPRCRVLRQPNGGVASARNRGIREARGEYVAPIDADDLWHPEKIVKQVRVAQSEPSLGFVYAWHRRIDAAGRVIGVQPPAPIAGNVFHQLSYRNFVGNGSALLIPRAAALECGGYDERLRQMGVEGCEDYLLQLKLAEGRAVAVVPEYLVGYREIDGAMSNDKERMFGSWREAVALFVADGGELSPKVLDWAFSFRAMEIAVDRVRRRRWRAALALVGTVAARDPLGLVNFSYRLMQYGAWQWRERGRDPADRPPFAGAEHGRGAVGGEEPRRARTFLRDLFPKRRMRRLARLDGQGSQVVRGIATPPARASRQAPRGGHALAASPAQAAAPLSSTCNG